MLAALGQIEPALIKDNQLDIDALKALLGQDDIAGPEHYELSWAGKSAARREIQKSTSNTLRPAADNPDRAPHMLIEGENLEVLRVLQKSYYGKVKMIYIDPPYNTGNDSFVYPDDYAETLDEYQRRTGERNEAGHLNKQSLWKKNSKESGHYHSNWLSMMYPRLYLARNLLREDGVIFISIDDNEAATLKLLCDEVFGEGSYLGLFLWQKKKKPSFLKEGFGSMYEYVLCYLKNASYGFPFSVDRTEAGKKYPINNSGNPLSVLLFRKGCVEFSDENCTFEPSDMSEGNIVTRLLDCFEVVNHRNLSDFRLEGEFRYSQDRLDEIFDNCERVTISKSPFRPNHVKVGGEVKKMHNLINSLTYGVGTNEDGSSDLMSLIKGDYFDNPKPSSFIKVLCKAVTYGVPGAVVLDFFAGSGTTAQAVMELNLEDGGNRQCICVQMPEPLEAKSEAYEAGYRTISDITRTRIDKVIEKLKAEHPEKTEGLACAHLTLASSNFQGWRSDVQTVEGVKAQMELSLKAEKPRVTLADAEMEQAMLTELLLKLGLGALGVDAISKAMMQGGVKVHRVLLPDDRDLWLCFEPYKPELKEAIIKKKPAQVILLSSAFQGEKADEALANLQLELDALDINLTVV